MVKVVTVLEKQKCKACQGSGKAAGKRCPACKGTGMVEIEVMR